MGDRLELRARVLVAVRARWTQRAKAGGPRERNSANGRSADRDELINQASLQQ
jgi:hypothetical protein